MSKKDKDANSKIYNYLVQQNRPYSVNDIFLNLHKEIGKTAVQKCLDGLVQDGSVCEKVYGKQKVYVVNQNAFPPMDEVKLKELDVKINNLSEELKTKTKELNDLEAKCRSLGSSLTTEEAELQIKEIEEEVSNLEKSLSKTQGNGEIVSQQEKERVQWEREKMLKEWRKRKRIATDILDAILEGYPKSKKDLFEQIGIETDQDAAVDVSLFR